MDISAQLEQLFEKRILAVPTTEELKLEIAAEEAILVETTLIPPATSSKEEWHAFREEGDAGFESGTLLPNWLKPWQEKGLDMIEHVSIPAPGGELSVCLYEPQGTPKGAPLYTHGGGWCAGSASQFAFNHAMTVEDCGLLVAAVDYRKAPEAPYPAAQDDCEAAALWLIDYAKQEFSIENTFVQGGSAGGHLAMATAIRMKHKHNFLFYGIVAEIPCADFTLGLPSRVTETFVGAEDFTRMSDYYIPDPEQKPMSDASLLYHSNEELESLPPIFFSCAERDGLRDDALLMFMRWMQAGNDAYILILNGMNHNIFLREHPASELAVRAPIAFLNRLL